MAKKKRAEIIDFEKIIAKRDRILFWEASYANDMETIDRIIKRKQRRDARIKGGLLNG